MLNLAGSIEREKATSKASRFLVSNVPSSRCQLTSTPSLCSWNDFACVMRSSYIAEEQHWRDREMLPRTRDHFLNIIKLESFIKDSSDRIELPSVIDLRGTGNETTITNAPYFTKSACSLFSRSALSETFALRIRQRQTLSIHTFLTRPQKQQREPETIGLQKATK